MFNTESSALTRKKILLENISCVRINAAFTIRLIDVPTSVARKKGDKCGQNKCAEEIFVMIFKSNKILEGQVTPSFLQNKENCFLTVV